MKDYKNIDRLFQEKFRDFEQTPHPEVWENISSTLSGKPKKDRRALWLWFSGVAAGLAILFSINNPFLTTNPVKDTTTDTNEIIRNPETEISSLPNEGTTPTTKEIIPEIDNNLNSNTIDRTNTRMLPKVNTAENNSTKNSQLKIADTHLSSKDKSSNPSTKINSDKGKPIEVLAQQSKETTKLSEEPKIETPDKKPFQSNESLLADNSDSNKITKQSLEVLDKDKSQSEKVIAKNRSNKKWILSTMAAPVLMSAFDKDVSSIDSQFNNNNKEGRISAAFGVQLAYQVNERLIVQSGLHKVDYGYRTNDVYVSPDRYASVYSNINYDDNINLVEISPIPSSDSGVSNQETGLEDAKGSLTQVFGYYEIPLEAKYSLKGGNFGVNILGGFSTLILDKNEIYIQTDDFSNKIGEAANLNRINLTGNVGLEFDYKLYQNVHFNVTPMIKVHANTFKKDTGGFSPYAIGIYSGLNFRF